MYHHVVTGVVVHGKLHRHKYFSTFQIFLLSHHFLFWACCCATLQVACQVILNTCSSAFLTLKLAVAPLLQELNKTCFYLDQKTPVYFIHKSKPIHKQTFIHQWRTIACHKPQSCIFVGLLLPYQLLSLSSWFKF